MGRPAIGNRAMTDAERQRRRRERLKEQPSALDSKQAKALAYILASGKAGVAEQEAMKASGISSEGHLCYLATVNKAMRGRDRRWYTPQNLPAEELKERWAKSTEILIRRGVSLAELLASLKGLATTDDGRERNCDYGKAHAGRR